MGISVDHVPYLTLAALTLALTLFLARACSRMVREQWQRDPMRRATADFIARFVFSALLLLGTTTAFRIAGADITLFVGAITFGIGFGLRDWFENLMAGAIIVTSKPFDTKSFISGSFGTGTVAAIDPRTTQVKTMDNQTRLVPNSILIHEPLHLFATYPERLTVLRYTLSSDTDAEAAAQLFETQLAANEKILKEPEPLVLLTDMTTGALVFELRFWTSAAVVKNKMKFVSALQLELGARLEEAGFSMPNPVLVLNVNRHDSGTLAR